MEPIPAFSAMLMAVKMARFEDDAVREAHAALDAAARATRASDAEAWRGVYAGALRLVDKVLEAHDRTQKAAETEARRLEVMRAAVSLAPAVSQELQREASEWGNRLTAQVAELEQKAARSVEKLAVTARDDEHHGRTVYEVEAGQLDGLKGWFDAVVGAWWANNEALVAQRSNEALAPLLGTACPVSIEIGAMRGNGRPAVTLIPKGHDIVTPGRFEALGATYKYVMSAVMGTSMVVAVVASKMQVTGLSTVVGWVFGAVFLGALVSAAVTVPKKQRQARARLLATATGHVHHELVQILARELRTQKDAQHNALRKHLAGEGRRVAAALREITGASNPGMGPMRMPAGLMAQDVQRVRGEWRAAIEQRIGELGAG